MSNEDKAVEKAKSLISEAEKKLSTKSFLEGLFGGASARFERALELFERAANLFKLAKSWKEAGDTFLKAAGIKHCTRYDTAQNFISAANCYRKYDPPKSINCLLRAVEIYTDMGRFLLAATNHEKIAQIYEYSLSDYRQTIQHYEQAADYYKGEENDTSSDKCLIKAAYYYSKEFCEYMKAIEIYEEVACSEMRSTLLKYGVKNYLFQAVLCYLCMDVASAEEAVGRYVEIFPAFSDSREYKFLNKIIKCINEDDLDEFTSAVANYDSVSRLDPWFVSMLLRVKDKFSDRPDIC